MYWIYGNEDRTEATYASVCVEDGCVVHRMTWIGPNGPTLVEDIVYGPVEELQQHLEGLYADQVWLRCGVAVGRYAHQELDLEGLEPKAKQEVLDQFAADLEARREPLLTRGVRSEPESVSVSPVAPAATDLIGRLEEAIVAALGQGRANDHDAVLARLAAAGHRVEAAEFYTALRPLIDDGTVQSSSSGGLWLSPDAA
jgi:hypothetical protein